MCFCESIVSSTDAVVVYVTAPQAEAPELARTLVERHLVACVNLVPAVRSFYNWQGQVHDDPEALLIIKTTEDGFEALRAAVVELHSYDVPEVISVPVTHGHAPYLSWIRDSLRDRTP